MDVLIPLTAYERVIATVGLNLLSLILLVTEHVPPTIAMTGPRSATKQVWEPIPFPPELDNQTSVPIQAI
ncbi:MAG: hypothetical protein ACYDEY_16170 [Acidimicrobiales bacterium]